MYTQSESEQTPNRELPVPNFAEILSSIHSSSRRSARLPLTITYISYTAGNYRYDFMAGQKALHFTLPATPSVGKPVLHSHNYFELMFVLSGSVEIQIENALYQYGRGDLCLFDRNIRHAELHQEENEVLYCCITKEFLDGWPDSAAKYGLEEDNVFSRFFDRSIEDEDSRCQFLEFRSAENGQEDTAALFDLFEAVRKELAGQRPGSRLIIYGLFCRLFSMLSDETQYTIHNISLQSDNLADVIRAYIDASPGRVKREEISAALHYNSDYLNRVLREQTGMTLSAYCNYTYMKKAASLLLLTNCSVEEIAAKIGFSNPSQFYRQFRRQYNMTPQEYRAFSRQYLNQDMPFPFPID